MIHVTDKSALEYARLTIEEHGLVVIKIIFGDTSEADLFVDDAVRWLLEQYKGDWRWQQNGAVVAFIIDKMVSNYQELLWYILDGSGHYIVRTWHVA